MKFTEPPVDHADLGTEIDGCDENPEDLAEYVVERIVSHRVADDSTIRLRVRWFGYNASQYTWEPFFTLPPELVRRYVRIRRLRPEGYGLPSC
jgi:hypothetical protein